MKPILIVNFKAYKQAVGSTAVKLAKICEAASLQTGYVVAVAVQASDIALIAGEVGIPVFAQHIDPVECGAFTGHILPEAVAQAGASGTLINHSEHRLELAVIDKTVKRAREAGLISCVCAKDATEAGRLATLKPEFVAYEPPELIGGKISVSKAKPEIIRKAVEKIGRNSVCIVGAGVKTAEDVRKSAELGARGVLVSSGITLAKDQKKAVLQLLEGFR